MRPCRRCDAEPARPRAQTCVECHLATRPLMEQVAAATERLALIPEPLRKARVPERDWPEGRRWCSGCQTFVRKQDCAKGASRCRTCAGISAHISRFASTYDVDPSVYNQLLNLQGGRCAICRRRPDTKRLVGDHDHQSGQLRGLCCTRCNHDLLGSAHDDVTILRAAVYYLENPPMTGRWTQPEIRDGSMPAGQIPY